MKLHTSTQTSSRAQGGLSLIFALLALVALSLGAVALIRSVDTGTLVLGNLGFKHDATVAAEQATEAAIDWLGKYSGQGNDSNSTTDGGGQIGYYAKNHDVDVTGQQGTDPNRELIDWEGDGHCSFAAHPGSCVLNPYTVSTDDKGGKTQYVIFRLCNATGTIADDSACSQPSAASNTSTKRGKLDYADYARFTSPVGPFYRIVVRSVSTRNTTSFTETIVHF